MSFVPGAGTVAAVPKQDAGSRTVALAKPRNKPCPALEPHPRTLPGTLSAPADSTAALHRASAESANPGNRLDRFKWTLFGRRSGSIAPFPGIARVHGARIRTVRNREAGLNEKRGCSSLIGCCLQAPAESRRDLNRVHHGKGPGHKRQKVRPQSRRPSGQPCRRVRHQSGTVPACLSRPSPKREPEGLTGMEQDGIPPSLDLNDLLGLKP